MNKDILEQLKQIEEQFNVKVVYCSHVGSRLQGTNHADSDTDYHFIFVPKVEDILLKQDRDFIKVGEVTKVKNTKDDTDFEGSSIYKYFNELKKSDTGAVDILFSMFREDTIVYQDTKFTETMKKHYSSFLNKNMKSFVGYALGQAMKFGIKGTRYKELKEFVDYLSCLESNDNKLQTFFDDFKKYIEKNNCKYIKFIIAPGPRSSGKQENIEYISILGKMFEGNVTYSYFEERVKSLEGQFGNRTKTIAETESKTDFKALSHAYRISTEVVELLETGFIKFPLKEADYIKQIKAGLIPTDFVISQVQDVLDSVDELLLKSDLPEEADTSGINKILLNMLERN